MDIEIVGMLILFFFNIDSIIFESVPDDKNKHEDTSLV